MKRRPRGLLILLTILAVLPCAASRAQSEADLDRVFLNLISYEAGDDPSDLELLNEWIVASRDAPDVRRGIERRLVQVLSAGDSTQAAKEFATKQLYRICTDDSVPGLRPLLLKESTSEMARYILEDLPGDAAQEALVWAMRKAGGSVQVAMINSLGERGDPSAVTALRNLSGNGDPKVMRAAMMALGKIGGRDAARALLWCSGNVRQDLRAVAELAYVRCADKALAEGNTDRAIEMYDTFLIGTKSREVRIAAFRGLVRADGELASDTILYMMSDGNPDSLAVAAAAAREVQSPATTRAFVEAFPSLPAVAQVSVLGVLAECDAGMVRPTVLNAERHEDAAVRAAALDALGSVGDFTDVPLLLKAVVRRNGPEQEAARRSLLRLNAHGVDDALARATMGSNNAIRIAAIRMIAARRSENVSGALIQAAWRDVDALRVEALKALAVVADIDDLEVLVDLFLNGMNDTVRSEAERTLAAVADRLADGAGRTKAIMAALGKDLSLAARVTLLRILGDLGDGTGIPTLLSATRRENAEVRDVALAALAQWPTAAPLRDLEKLARRLEDGPGRQTAFTGFMRLLSLPSERPVEETLKIYQRAVKLASTAEEKKQVLSGLAGLRDLGALDLIAEYLEDPEVLEEAALAKEKVEGKRD